jgi:hypothetical protein
VARGGKGERRVEEKAREIEDELRRGKGGMKGERRDEGGKEG